MLAAISPMASAAPTRFGSELDASVQPDGGTRTCPSGKTCTWVMAEPYSNPTGLKAPRDGRITKIRVIAGNKGGTFRPVLARLKSDGETAKVVLRGPQFTFAKQPDLDPPYKVQVFTVSMTVHKGDVLGVESKAMSFIRCSGGELPRFKPALPVGGPFRTTSVNEGCNLLIEAQYG